MFSPPPDIVDYFRNQFKEGTARCRETDMLIRKELSKLPDRSVTPDSLFTRVSRGVLTSSLMCNTHFIVVETSEDTLLVCNRYNHEVLIRLEVGPTIDRVAEGISTRNVIGSLGRLPKVTLGPVIDVIETFGLMAGFLGPARCMGLSDSSEISGTNETYIMVDELSQSVKITFYLYEMGVVDLTRMIIIEEIETQNDR